MEFECCKPVPVIRHVFVCLCACTYVYCELRLSTCLVIGSFHSGSAGGRASLKHRNEINDPCFCRCDQQTTLSSHSKTKELTEGGKVENTTTQEPLAITPQTFGIFFCLWGQQTNFKTVCVTLHLCHCPCRLSLTFRLKPFAK